MNKILDIFGAILTFFFYSCVILLLVLVGVLAVCFGLFFVPFVIALAYHFMVASYLASTFGYAWLNPPFIVLFGVSVLFVFIARIVFGFGFNFSATNNLKREIEKAVNQINKKN